MVYKILPAEGEIVVVSDSGWDMVWRRQSGPELKADHTRIVLQAVKLVSVGFRAGHALRQSLW